MTLFLPDAESRPGTGDPLDAGRPAAGRVLGRPARHPSGRPDQPGRDLEREQRRAPCGRSHAAQLGWDPADPLSVADWLSFPSQQLLSVTAGPVHHDGVGELTRLRERLAWYPPDLWRYLLAAGWSRLGEEERLMGRAGHAGDELGSAVIGGRLTRDLMVLGFLLERRYAPYPKWFGTAFERLDLGRR